MGKRLTQQVGKIVQSRGERREGRSPFSAKSVESKKAGIARYKPIHTSFFAGESIYRLRLM
jgi:hypothetical protein